MAGNWARVVGDLNKYNSGDGEKWVDIRYVVKTAPVEFADAQKGQGKDAACFLFVHVTTLLP